MVDKSAIPIHPISIQTFMPVYATRQGVVMIMVSPDPIKSDAYTVMPWNIKAILVRTPADGADYLVTR